MIDQAKTTNNFPMDFGNGVTWVDLTNENNQNLVFIYYINLPREKIIDDKEKTLTLIKATFNLQYIDELRYRDISLIFRYFSFDTKNILKEIVVYPQDW